VAKQGRPVSFKLTQEDLRRLVAEEVSRRGLAREKGVSDTAVRARLRTPAVAKRLLALQDALARPEDAPDTHTRTHESPSPGLPSHERASNPSPSTAPAEGQLVTVTRHAPRERGMVGSASFESHGRGPMRVGWNRAGRDLPPERDTRVRVASPDGSRVFLLPPDDPSVEHYAGRGWRVTEPR
jgi:hypothetical protein